MQGLARGGGHPPVPRARGGDDGSPSTRGARRGVALLCAPAVCRLCAPCSERGKPLRPAARARAPAAPGPAGAHGAVNMWPLHARRCQIAGQRRRRTGAFDCARRVSPSRARAAEAWRRHMRPRGRPADAVCACVQGFQHASFASPHPRPPGSPRAPTLCARPRRLQVLCARHARPTVPRRARAGAFRRRRALPARRRCLAPGASLLRRCPRPLSPGACRWRRVRSTCPATSTTTASRRTTTCSSRCVWRCRGGRARTGARCACAHAWGGRCGQCDPRGGNPASPLVLCCCVHSCAAVYTRVLLCTLVYCSLEPRGDDRA